MLTKLDIYLFITASEEFFSCIVLRLWRHDDNVCFVVSFYSAIVQQFANRYVRPLGHILLIPSQ